MVHGFWFLVSGFWFLVSGFWFLVSGFWWIMGCIHAVTAQGLILDAPTGIPSDARISLKTNAMGSVGMEPRMN
jgi:hypothetical protein